MRKTFFLIVIIIFSGISAFSQSKQDQVRDAYQYFYHRNPDAWEAIPQNYNNGNWGNIDDLRRYVGQYQKTMRDNAITFKFSQQTFKNNTVVVGVFQNGTQIAANLVASGGGNLVASGGGNLIASGGGNLVASGGGNLVASGGGNIVVNAQTKGANFGGSYVLASEGTKVIKTSGSGALIIR